MIEIITLASGCFWCTEALFKRLRGVNRVISGYANSNKKDPTYEEVCSGQTGAAEAVQIEFDPQQVPLDKLLEIFWHTHDPTTLNQQGNDIGTQYRSGVYYTTDGQKALAEKIKQQIDESGIYPSPLVTEILPLKSFYSAESYHQDYYALNRSKNAYCSLVIDPKISKLIKEYSHDIQGEYLKQEPEL